MPQKNIARIALIWIAIVLTVIGAMWMQSLEKADQPAGDAVPASAPVAAVDAQAEIVGKLVMLFDRFRGSTPTMTSDLVLQNAEPLSMPSAVFADRLSYTVLVGAVKGWSAGIERIGEVEAATDAERALKDALVLVMVERMRADDAGDDQGGVEIENVVEDDRMASAEDREAVLEKLGYFGRLVCDAPGVGAEATRAGIAMLAALAWYALAFLCGCVALVFTLIWLFRRPSMPETEGGAGEATSLVLGETFALWMVVFFGMNLGASVLAEGLVGAFGLEGTPRAAHVALACGFVGFVGSLVALVYPRLRGLRGVELRRSLGLHGGRGVLNEVGHGVLCYLSAVPLLIAGLIVFAILSAIVSLLSGDATEPGHPVTDLLAGADGLRIALLLLLASVAAPVVEEIMFRGALYGHLRGTFFVRNPLVSVMVAAVVSSFIFAVIHPQGVLFTPALGGLAVSFCLSRELRGSLIAPVVAHAINNAVTLALGLSLMG